jgi:hypothetical protein
MRAARSPEPRVGANRVVARVPVQVHEGRAIPITYRYKQPIADGSKPLAYGLIAEEVNE